MDMEFKGRVGPATLSDGVGAVARLTKGGGLVVQHEHGRFHEAAVRSRIFLVSTAVAGISHGTSFGATPPINLYNPPGSGKNLSILSASLGYISGTLGVGMVAYGKAVQITAPSGGTAITPVSSVIGGAAASVAQAGTGHTITNTPTILRGGFVLGAFVGGAGNPTPPLIDHIDGKFILTPGNVFVMQGIASAGTSPLLTFGIEYEEVDA